MQIRFQYIDIDVIFKGTAHCILSFRGFLFISFEQNVTRHHNVPIIKVNKSNKNEKRIIILKCLFTVVIVNAVILVSMLSILLLYTYRHMAGNTSYE